MISIIVTHKKDLNYLRDSLESIADQKFKDIETILVLDHTEDDVSELVETYKDDIHLKIYELDQKTGVSVARNLGIEKATGEYIMFLDNDDYMCGESLQSFMDVMDAETDIVYGQVKGSWFKRDAYISGQAEEIAGEAEILAKLDFNDPINYFIERYSSLERLTVLGALYRKSLFVENGISFNEEQIFYADAKVVAGLFSKAGKIKGTEAALYIRRNHNDKFDNPALNQFPRDETMPYYFVAYNNAVRAAENQRIREHLNLILAKFIAREFPKKFRGSDDSRWRKEFYEQMLSASQTINKETVKKSDMKRYNKNFVFTFMKGNRQKTVKKLNRLLARKKLKRILKDKRFRYKTITLYIFSKMSFKENWIVLESFMGRNYSGQPKYIYQYLQEKYGDKYTYIWSVDKKGIKIDGKHKTCKKWSLKYFYYLNRSKYWVTNMRQPLSVPRREETICLSTWHGTPLKKLVFDMDDVHSVNPHYKNIVYQQSRGWDYLLSDNPFSTEKFESCFRFDRDKILEVGYPANDPLYSPDLEKKAQAIKDKLGIPQNKKVLLYAPTWRDDNYYDAGEYKFELALDIERLKKEFEDEYVLLLRMHYWIVDHLDLSEYGGFVYNVSDYDDITELYMISDICMTDYSSVFFDFANLRRPILYYTYDLEKYRDVLRGFYLDIEKDLPGPLLLTNDDVVNAIKNIDKISDEYADKYKEFYDRFCCIDDGHASQRVVEAVFK